MYNLCPTISHPLFKPTSHWLVSLPMDSFTAWMNPKGNFWCGWFKQMTSYPFASQTYHSTSCGMLQNQNWDPKIVDNFTRGSKQWSQINWVNQPSHHFFPFSFSLLATFFFLTIGHNFLLWSGTGGLLRFRATPTSSLLLELSTRLSRVTLHIT